MRVLILIAGYLGIVMAVLGFVCWRMKKKPTSVNVLTPIEEEPPK